MKLIPALAVGAAMLCRAAAAADDQLWLPTGQTVTSQAAPGSVFQALTADLPVVGKQLVGGGATTAVSPDGKSLFVLTAGYNSWRGPDGKRIRRGFYGAPVCLRDNRRNEAAAGRPCPQ